MMFMVQYQKVGMNDIPWDCWYKPDKYARLPSVDHAIRAYKGPKAAYWDSSLYILVTTSACYTPFVHTISRNAPDLVTSTVQFRVGDISKA